MRAAAAKGSAAASARAAAGEGSARRRRGRLCGNAGGGAAGGGEAGGGFGDGAGSGGIGGGIGGEEGCGDDDDATLRSQRSLNKLDHVNRPYQEKIAGIKSTGARKTDVFEFSWADNTEAYLIKLNSP